MDKIMKDENGFFYMNSFIEYVSKKNYKNYVYVRYLFNKQGRPIQDIKEILEENNSIIKYGKNGNRVINPITTYFAFCMIEKDNIKKDIDFYNEILRNGINASDEEVTAFNDYLKYGRDSLDDFQILVLFMCVLTLYRKNQIFSLDANKRYFDFFKENKNRNIKQRIYNLLKTKGNCNDIKQYILNLNDKG